MALNVSDMVDEIVAFLPSEWQPGYAMANSPSKEWMTALCTDAAAMWATIVLTPGLGPPSLPPYNHGHTVLTPVTPITTALFALGPPNYQPVALRNTMFINVATQIALHLSASVIIAPVDSAIGAVTHDHTLAAVGVPQNPFVGLSATAATMKASIVSALTGAGFVNVAIPYPSGVPSLDTLFGAVSEGMLLHMEDNGQLSMSVGSGHVHALS